MQPFKFNSDCKRCETAAIEETGLDETKSDDELCDTSKVADF